MPKTERQKEKKVRDNVPKTDWLKEKENKRLCLRQIKKKRRKVRKYVPKTKRQKEKESNRECEWERKWESERVKWTSEGS